MAQNGYFIEDLEIGMAAEFAKTVTSDDIVAFADVSGDNNPLHLDEDYAAGTIFKTRIAHGMLTASFLSAILGTKLPGPGAIYLSQSIRSSRATRSRRGPPSPSSTPSAAARRSPASVSSAVSSCSTARPRCSCPRATPEAGAIPNGPAHEARSRNEIAA